MKKIVFTVLIITISFGSPLGVIVANVEVSVNAQSTTKIFSFGDTSFSTLLSNLRRKGDLDENERDRLINTNREEVNHGFKFYSFRNKEKTEEENRSTYFARAPPILT